MHGRAARLRCSAAPPGPRQQRRRPMPGTRGRVPPTGAGPGSRGGAGALISPSRQAPPPPRPGQSGEALRREGHVALGAAFRPAARGALGGR